MNNYFNKSISRHLFGLGFDGNDGHKRITKGDYFHLIGGSEETHLNMQEKTIKLTEELGKRGKSIITASDEEFYETAVELGLTIYSPTNN